MLAGIRLVRQRDEVAVHIRCDFVPSRRIRLALGGEAERHIDACKVGCKSGSGAKSDGGSYESFQREFHDKRPLEQSSLMRVDSY